MPVVVTLMLTSLVTVILKTDNHSRQHFSNCVQVMLDLMIYNSNSGRWTPVRNSFRLHMWHLDVSQMFGRCFVFLCD